MRKVFTAIKGEAGRYYLHYKGVCYAHVYKTRNNSWFYEDSDRAYWFNTLTEAKEHFQKINWTNGIKVPFDINTFKFMRGDVI